MACSTSTPHIRHVDMSSRISATAALLRMNARASAPLWTACASKPDTLNSDTNERARATPSTNAHRALTSAGR
jgi:hypothetical protein